MTDTRTASHDATHTGSHESTWSSPPPGDGHAGDSRSVAPPKDGSRPSDADVGVVGAGFAGLAAGLTLRRHRRSVLVFDGGPCRNAWSHEVHGYLGARGVSGKELRDLGRAQVQEVGARLVEAQVTRATREDGAFRLADDDGRSWRVDRLLIATGVTDDYPDIENFFDFFGQTVYVCPHCDAYEVRDRPIAIVAWSEATLPFTLKLTQWTRRITVVTDGREPALDDEARRQLAEHGIPIVTQSVRCFEGRDGQLEALRFYDGSALPVEAAFFNIGHHFQNELATRLGCKLNPAGCINVDDHLRTSVDGVWAAGDVAGEEQLVTVAAAHGVKAAIDIYRSLPLPTGELTPS